MKKFFIVFCLFFLAASLNGQEKLRSAYPLEAPEVPLKNAADLQKLLKKFGAVRLLPGDYKKSFRGKLTVKSNQKIYGLNTTAPDIIIEPGSTGIILSGIHTQLEFPGSNKVTRDNIFSRLTYSHILVDGATLENNLFLNASYQSWKVDNSKQGYLKNNRIVKFLSHGGNPSIDWSGDRKGLSTGNSFLWINMLDPRGRSMNIDGIKDLSLIFLDCESYTGETDTAMNINGLDNLTIFGSGGLVHHGRSLKANAKQYFLQGHHMGSIEKPDLQVKGIDSFINIDDGQTHKNTIDGKPELELNIFSEDLHNKSFILNSDDKIKKLSSKQTELLKASICTPSTAPVPGPEFEDVDSQKAPMAKKTPSVSDSLQKEINEKGIIYLKAGVYTVDKPLKLGRGKGIVGSGKGKTFIVAQSPDINIIENDGSAGITLCDLTLQDGKNGIYLYWEKGPNLQYTDILLSHVNFRNFSDSGFKFKNIYGVDNNYIDYVSFIDCKNGFKQEADHHGNDSDPALCYMDKNVFYQCQFIRCETALDLLAFRNSQNNAWINCLFKDCKKQVAKLQSHSLAMFANCDFRGNAGSPSISSNGRLYLISCNFNSNNPDCKDIVDSYSLTVEGCVFTRSGRAKTVFQSGEPSWIAMSHPDNKKTFEARNTYMYNSKVDMPAGNLLNGVFINTLFTKNRSLNSFAFLLKNQKKTVFADSPVKPAPSLLILR